MDSELFISTITQTAQSNNSLSLQHNAALTPNMIATSLQGGVLLYNRLGLRKKRLCDYGCGRDKGDVVKEKVPYYRKAGLRYKSEKRALQKLRVQNLRRRNTSQNSYPKAMHLPQLKSALKMKPRFNLGAPLTAKSLSNARLKPALQVPALPKPPFKNQRINQLLDLYNNIVQPEVCNPNTTLDSSIDSPNPALKGMAERSGPSFEWRVRAHDKKMTIVKTRKSHSMNPVSYTHLTLPTNREV
eukprot:TRINITY_DN8685_c0_g1_i10.p1 TRINITY_DN8685_c0_g1~~TRINITY_DN8685_c0_g1_i10.p1  ORF type:complete len:243 (+),score=60.59 TRINITY_DN8685_c0_g1_i10:124-852(+)